MVTEVQMRALFEEGRHPDRDALLAAKESARCSATHMPGGAELLFWKHSS